MLSVCLGVSLHDLHIQAHIHTYTHARILTHMHAHTCTTQTTFMNAKNFIQGVASVMQVLVFLVLIQLNGERQSGACVVCCGWCVVCAYEPAHLNLTALSYRIV